MVVIIAILWMKKPRLGRVHSAGGCWSRTPGPALGVPDPVS